MHFGTGIISVPMPLSVSVSLLGQMCWEGNDFKLETHRWQHHHLHLFLLVCQLSVPFRLRSVRSGQIRVSAYRWHYCCKSTFPSLFCLSPPPPDSISAVSPPSMFHTRKCRGVCVDGAGIDPPTHIVYVENRQNHPIYTHRHTHTGPQR